MSVREYEKTGGGVSQVRPTHRALDGQVFATINRRAYGDEVFVPGFCAQGLERHACERIDEFVWRKFVPEISGSWARRLSDNYGRPYPSIEMNSGLNNSSAEHSLIGYETLGSNKSVSVCEQ